MSADIRRLTADLWRCKDDQRRLVLLRCKWKLGLPMSTAILSVCWPDTFTVYDVRVCEQLGDFGKLKNITDPGRLWEGYERFVKAVRATSPRGSSLRECDHYLWARSGAEKLRRDIENKFQKGK